MKTLKALALGISLALLPALASAGDFPEKDLTYQITFNPGGGSDIRARQQQPKLEADLGVKIPARSVVAKYRRLHGQPHGIPVLDLAGAEDVLGDVAFKATDVNDILGRC